MKGATSSLNFTELALAKCFNLFQLTDLSRVAVRFTSSLNLFQVAPAPYLFFSVDKSGQLTI